MKGAPRTKQYQWFHGGAPKTSSINAFYAYTLGKQWQIKIKKQESENFTF